MQSVLYTRYFYSVYLNDVICLLQVHHIKHLTAVFTGLTLLVGVITAVETATLGISCTLVTSQSNFITTTSHQLILIIMSNLLFPSTAGP